MRLLSLLAITTLAACASNVEEAGDIDRLADLLEGTFDTHAANPELPPEDRLVDRRIRVDAQSESSFYGVVNPETCIITSSRTGKLRAIGAESVVGENGLRQAERGFDPETREQLFGTAQGEYYELKRIR